MTTQKTPSEELDKILINVVSGWYDGVQTPIAEGGSRMSQNAIKEAKAKITKLINEARVDTLQEIADYIISLYNPDITDLEKDEHQDNVRQVIYQDQILDRIKSLRKEQE